MSDKTGIEWTDATWNPVTGCTEMSPGCDRCYAKTFAERWRGTEGHYFENGFDVQLRPAKLDQPLRWTRPRRIFVNSMSDLFHDQVPDEYIAQVWGVMAWSPRHTYQLLTKRHGRMRSLLSSPAFKSMVDDAWYQIGRDHELGGMRANPGHPLDRWPLPNVWLGVSAEDQKRADLRIPALLDTPAAVRFISAEPLLGPIDLMGQGGNMVGAGIYSLPDPPEYEGGDPVCQDHGREQCPDCTYLDWVIVGGESGPGARRMEWEWAATLRDQCAAADVPFHFKQSGSVLAREWGYGGKGGDPIEWPDWRGGWPRQYPEQVTA